jgi:formylglycine-generating enzyme required for sulfatase activity/serine/threonine protein kinase
MLDNGDKVGEYTLIRFLGKGQFGEVWLAEKGNELSRRKFSRALKFISIRDEDINLPDAKDEIDTWMEASGHPNVISVLDMLVHKNFVVIASEYADGGSLKEWLKAQGGKSSTPEKALELTIGILRGLEHLHARNVVHRDLKPENILLQGEFPRITDFGISRIISENTTATNAIGTPIYMSPEAFHGNKQPQTDIWSAGVIMYEMLTGIFPFEGSTMFAVRDSVRRDEPRALPDDLEPDIARIIIKALQKNRETRYQTAREMRSAVEKILNRFRALITNKVTATLDPEISIVTERIIRSTEIPAAESAEILVIESAEIPAVESAEIPAVESAEIPVVESAEIPVVESTGIPVMGSTEIPAGLETVKEEGAEGRRLGQTYFIPPARKTRETHDSTVGSTGDFPLEDDGEKEKRLLHAPAKVSERLKRTRTVAIAFFVIAVAGLLGLLILIGAQSGVFGFKTVTNSSSTPIPNANTTPEVPSTTVVEAATLPDPPAGMVYIPGGEFLMGRNEGTRVDEEPAHKVSVRPFFMDMYEITNGQYAGFVTATNHPAPPGWKNDTFPDGKAKFPVTGVNWNDARTYAKWAGKRLPTEEEWEFAARGEKEFLYPWGDQWDPGLANADQKDKSVAEIGKFQGKSPFGVFDMSGNVWEWTSSDYKAYPNGKISKTFVGKANLKTIRGNSFLGSKDFSTTTYRIGWAITGAANYSRTGFRCVQDADK